MIRKRGNAHWSQSGAAIPLAPAFPTEFEIQVRRLQLTPDVYASSGEHRGWCERKKNRFYIPEWLLDMWVIPVDPDLSNAAKNHTKHVVTEAHRCLHVPDLERQRRNAFNSHDRQCGECGAIVLNLACGRLTVWA
jgi:hypothetical protein